MSEWLSGSEQFLTIRILGQLHRELKRTGYAGSAKPAG